MQARASTTLPGAITASGTIEPADNVGDANPGNNSDSASASVIRLPDLTVSIVDGPDLVQAGAHVQFKVNVETLGGNASSIREPVGQNFVTCHNGSLGDPNLARF